MSIRKNCMSSDKPLDLDLKGVSTLPTKRAICSRLTTASDHVAFLKDNFAIEAQNQCNITESIAQADCLYDAGDLNQRVRQGALTNADGMNQKGQIERECKSLLQGGSNYLLQSSFKPLEHFHNFCERLDENEIKSQPVAFISSNQTGLESGNDLKSDADRGSAAPMEHYGHTTIEKMFESIIRPMADTKLSTSDTSLNDADQLISIMGDNNSHNTDEEEKKEGVDCHFTKALESTVNDSWQDANDTTDTCKLVGFRMSENTKAQSSGIRPYDLGESSEKENKEIPNVYSVRPKAKANENQSTYTLLKEESFNTIDVLEESPCSIGYFKGPTRDGRTTSRDINRGKWSRGLSLSLERATKAARNLVGKARGRSLSPPKTRGSLDLIIDAGKTFIRKSKDVAFALGCLTYETDSDKTELSDLDDRHKGSSIFAKETPSLEICYPEDIFGPHSTGENINLRVTTEKKPTAHRKEEKQPSTCVSTLVEYFENIEQDQNRLLKDNRFTKIHENLARASEDDVFPCSSELRENLREEMDLSKGVQSLESTALRGKWGLVVEETEDKLHKAQNKTNIYDTPDIQIDDYDNQEIDRKLEIENETKTYSCEETASESSNLGDQITNVITNAQDDLLNLEEHSLGEIATSNNLEETVDIKMSEFYMQKEDLETENSPKQSPVESCKKERGKWRDVAPVLAIEFYSHSFPKEDIDTSSEKTQKQQKLDEEEESCSEEIIGPETPNSAPPPNSPKSGFCVEGTNVGTTISLFETRSLLCSTSARESEIDADLNKIIGSRSAEARLECAILHEDQKSLLRKVRTKYSLNDVEYVESKCINLIEEDSRLSCSNSLPTGGGQIPLKEIAPKIYKNLNMTSHFFTYFGDEDEEFIEEGNIQMMNKTLDAKSDTFGHSLAIKRNNRPATALDSYSAPNILEEIFSKQRATLNEKNGLNDKSDADLKSLQEDKIFHEGEYQLSLIENNQTKSEPVLCFNTENVGKNPGQKRTESSSSYWAFSKLPEEPKKLEAIDELPSPPSISPCSSNQSVVFTLKRYQFEDNLLDATGSYGNISKEEEVTDTSTGSDSLSYHRDSEGKDNNIPAYQHLSCQECSSDTYQRLYALTYSQPSGSMEVAGQSCPNVVNNGSMPFPAITVEDCESYEEEEAEGMNLFKCRETLDITPLAIQDTQEQTELASCSFLRVSDRQTDLTDFVPRKETQLEIANSKVAAEILQMDSVVEKSDIVEATDFTSTNERVAHSTGNLLETDELLKISKPSKSGTFPILRTLENKSLAGSVNLENKVDMDNEQARCLQTSLSLTDPREKQYRPQHHIEFKSPNGTTLPDIFGDNSDIEIRPCYNKQLRTSPRCVRWDLEPEKAESSPDTVSLSTEEEDLFPDRCNSCLKTNANHKQGCQERCYQSKMQVRDCADCIHNDLEKTIFDQNNNEALAYTKDKLSDVPMYLRNADSFKTYTVAMKPNAICHGIGINPELRQTWCTNHLLQSPQIVVKDIAMRNLVPSLERQISTTRYTLHPILPQHNSNLDLCIGNSADNNVSQNIKQTKSQWGARSIFKKRQLEQLSENKISLSTPLGTKTNLETERVNDYNIPSLNTLSFEPKENNHKDPNINISTLLQKLRKCFQNHSNLTPDRYKKTDNSVPVLKNQRGEIETSIDKPLSFRPGNLQSKITSIPNPEVSTIVESLSDKMEKSHKTITKTLKLVERAQKRIDQCDAMIDKSLTTLQKSSEVSKKCQRHLENVNRLLCQKASERSVAKM